jgi:hypothetical protein
VRAGIVATLVTSIMLAGVPALASTGVTAAPGRQMIEPDQRTAEVYVVNAGSETVELVASDWKHTEATGWVKEDAGLGFTPRRFTLDPQEQQTVVVTIPEADETPCRLLGAGFAVVVRETEGLTVRASGISQLARAGVGGSESDCLAVLPALPVKPAPPFEVPWLWILVGLGGLAAVGGSYAVGRRRS